MRTYFFVLTFFVRNGTIDVHEFGALWKYVQDWKGCFDRQVNKYYSKVQTYHIVNKVIIVYIVLYRSHTCIFIMYMVYTILWYTLVYMAYAYMYIIMIHLPQNIRMIIKH